VIAVAAGRGYEPPPLIRGDTILVDGVRLPYLNTRDEDAPRPATIPFANLPGSVDPDFPIRGAQPSAFVPLTVGPLNGTVDRRFFPFVGSVSGSANALTATDVTTIITQAAIQADITRAAIRQPLGSPARVNITVVDTEGRVLGIFRTFDAPVFGFDVSAQKARTAALFSRVNGGALLRGAGMGSYVDRAAADGIRLTARRPSATAPSASCTARSSRTASTASRPAPSAPASANGASSTSVSNSISSSELELTLAGRAESALHFDSQRPRTASKFSRARCRSTRTANSSAQSASAATASIRTTSSPPREPRLCRARGDTRRSMIIRGTRLPFVKFPRSPNL
jgi:hypothetical protein